MLIGKLRSFAQYWSIKSRILVTFTILSCLAMFLFYDWVSNSARRHYLEASEELMIDQAMRLSGIVLQDGNFTQEALAKLFHNEQKFPTAQIYDIQKTNSDSKIYITDDKGFLLYHSDTNRQIDFSEWHNIRKALRGEYGARSTRPYRNGKLQTLIESSVSMKRESDGAKSSVLHVTLPLIKDDVLVGSITVVKPVRRLHLYLDSARQRMLKRAVITLALILCLGVLLMRRITQPLERLTQYVKQLKLDKECKKPQLPEGELKELAGVISDMRAELDGKEYIESYVQALTHEFKSPLSAIQGAVELLDIPDDDYPTQRLLKNIDRESQRLNQMVQQLLLLSRLENKPQAENFEDIDLGKFLKEITNYATSQCHRPFTLHTPDTPVTIRGDRFGLQLAFSNLLVNANEFTPNDGKIDIILENSGKLQILDEGTGIPDYAIEKIFERFYSLPRPISGAKSSGLGLAIVAEIIKEHSGNISIRNREEKGVEVELSFPLKEN